MAGQVRYLLNRDGRFFARLVVPKELRKIVGKTELRSPLGPDRRAAMKRLPGAVAVLQDQIAQAEQKAAASGSLAIQPGRYPLAPDQIAASHYAQRLAFDEQLRNDPRYASTFIDTTLVERLRTGIAGRLTDQELMELVGPQVERFRRLGNHDAAPGSDEWRIIARAIVAGELEALARAAERDEGDFTGQPDNPLIINAQPPDDAPAPVSIKSLWGDYVKSRQILGSMRDGGRRQVLAVYSLVDFVKHDDANRVTKKDMADWLDHALITHSPATISKVYLPTIRSLFRWAHEKDRIKGNPAADIRLSAPKKVQNRERGYTTPEAVKVLAFARDYRPFLLPNGKPQEAAYTIAAKHWVPWLCAFTGARVAEICQLRREDIREEAGAHIIRITPEAGGTKTGQWRDVPLHPQVIALGFLDYVNTVPAGPLFHGATDPAKNLAHAKRMSNRIGDWLQAEKLVPDGVQPSHGWRHRLKTIGREVGIQDRVLDAIQGHAPRTAGDNYGDITLKTRIDAINKLPEYDPPQSSL